MFKDMFIWVLLSLLSVLSVAFYGYLVLPVGFIVSSSYIHIVAVSVFVILLYIIVLLVNYKLASGDNNG